MSKIPQNAREILLHAEKIREKSGYTGGPVNVMGILDRMLLEYGLIYHIVEDLRDRNGVPQDARLNCGPSPFIEITNDTYKGSLDWHPRCSFTVAHEIGHYVLHREAFTSSVALPRMSAGASSFRLEHPQEEAEANCFAGALLLPLQAVTPSTKPETAAAEFRLSIVAAEISIRTARACFPSKWRLTP